jgi:OOP family OmpA-OmpF porin
MEKLMCRAGLWSLAALVLSTPVLAQSGSNPMVGKGQWYLSPMASWVAGDKERLTDGGFGGQLGVGRMLSPNIALELNGFGGVQDGFNEVGQYGAGLDVLMFGNVDGNFSPYVVFGAGYLRSQVSEGSPNNGPFEDTDSAILSVGGGGLFRLGSFPGRLRTEVRLRNEQIDGPNLTDVVVSAGMLFPFGKVRGIVPLDSDGDGVIDAEDRCPGSAAGAIVDAVGCELDSDGDGVPDRVDQCAGTEAGVRVDATGCALDSDGDGVPDFRDVCPGTPPGTLVGVDGCPLDSDRDGVVDDRDECPGTAAGVRVDFRGCEIRDEIRLPGVTFESNAATLTAGSLGILNGAVSTLERYEDIEVECSGHTDSRGAADYNQQLSQRRAQAVCDYLASRGIDPARLSARGYGESQPIADNETMAGRLENRRVTLRVID